MALHPIAERELRALARRPGTFWMRVLGPLALWVSVFGLDLPLALSAGRGGRVFAFLHGTLFCGIWIVVPMLTADCLSRERREGTLPLLFLTPLRPLQIVLSKALAHGLRATTFIVAALPVLTLPFLMGGVSWKEACFSALINLASLCLALGAGLLASSASRERGPAILGALLRAAVCLSLLGLIHAFLFMAIMLPFLGPNRWNDLVQHSVEIAAVLLADWSGSWGDALNRWPPQAGIKWLLVSGLTAFGALGALLLMSWLAGRNLRRGWLEIPVSGWRLWAHDFFCTPVILRSFHQRWLGRKLERNPITWVELRSWRARALHWVWVALFILCPFVLLAAGGEVGLGFLPPETALAVAPLLGLAISSASSLQRERESGVLELLLITPYHEAQIILGRLRGLWQQFGLGLLLWFVGYALIRYHTDDGFGRRHDAHPTWASPAAMVVAFAAVPVIGLYFSLTQRTFQRALISTLTVVVLAPILAVGFSHWVALGYWRQARTAHEDLPLWACTLMVMAVHGCLLALFARRLHQRLVQRSFAFQHGAA
jgi:ABC-type Na+ efflux pump permease subunit